jgi:hypothetical protein
MERAGGENEWGFIKVAKIAKIANFVIWGCDGNVDW